MDPGWVESSVERKWERGGWSQVEEREVDFMIHPNCSGFMR